MSYCRLRRALARIHSVVHLKSQPSFRMIGAFVKLRSTYLNCISENAKVDIHKGKIMNVQADRHEPKIDRV